MSFPSAIRLSALAVAVTSLAACSTLPSSGPTVSDIRSAEQDGADFAIVDLDQTVIAQLTQSAAAPVLPAGPWWRTARVDVIGPGDVLQIAVYEIGAALFVGQSGMWGITQSGARPPGGSAEVLPATVVERDGAINLPWIGHVVAAGKTPSQLGEEIAAALQGKSQDPQVLVSVQENLSNTVVVMGDVRQPGRVPLTLAGERLLDAVALAGGAPNPPDDTVVELHRDGQVFAARLSTIGAGSALNVPLNPQDRVVVQTSPRTYTVFGAAGKVSETPFQSPRLTLAEAIARTGGPNPAQADATAIFVLRYDGLNLDGRPAVGARPVAYRLNMMEPESYFLAQRFEMRPGDVVYIANARSNQSIKLIDVFNKFFSPVFTIRPLIE